MFKVLPLNNSSMILVLATQYEKEENRGRAGMDYGVSVAIKQIDSRNNFVNKPLALATSVSRLVR